MEGDQVKAFGAGILSRSESAHASASLVACQVPV